MLPKYNAFQLKLFMVILMVFDHIDHIPGLLPIELAGVFHVLTHCVGVFFAFLAVDGFRYTHDRKRYVLRLFVWAAIMAAGNTVYNLIAADPALSIHNNIFFPLALGALLFVMSFVPYPTLSETLTMLAINSEFMFPLVIPFLAMYDGTRGPKTAFSKYFFYVFYPLHLWIIGLIALLVR